MFKAAASENLPHVALKPKCRVSAEFFVRNAWVLYAVASAVYLCGFFLPESFVGVDFSRKELSPSFGHPFGTDWMGRDMLSRSLKGLSVSFTVGVLASSLAALCSVFIGVLTVLASPRVDRMVSWAIDVVMSIPQTVFVILISCAVGGGFLAVVSGIAATHWAGLARLVRAEVIRLRVRPFVLFSRRAGHGCCWIVRHHIIREIFPLVLVGSVLLVPHAILHEAAISFLGFGLSPEKPSIGLIIAESVKELYSGSWWLTVFPGALLCGCVFILDVISQRLTHGCEVH